MGTFELFEDNYEQAVALSLKAMELNPCDAYIKARCASVMTYVGDPERSLALLDEAEALDPLLPVWCVEERGVALYALDRYEEALASLHRLMFQTYRSRLYRAAALIALGRADEASKLVKEAEAGNPGLTIANFTFKERFRDHEKRRQLRQRLKEAGLPK
jgi:adenylate cyclase